MTIKNLILSLLASVGLTTSCTAQSNIKSVSPKEFKALLESDTLSVVVDVRTAAEYAEGHLAGASNIDFLKEQEFDKAVSQLSQEKHYYVYCRSGRRSMGAASKMNALGLKVVDMKGGYLAWTSEGMPVTKIKEQLQGSGIEVRLRDMQ